MELMSLAGVSAGLGAFVAGVMLASSEYRHELEADLEPFKGLFLGLFFITIGAGINLGLLGEHWAAIAGLLVAFVAIKCVALHLQAWGLRVAHPERLAFATLLGQGGEFGFVIVGLAMAGAMLTAEQGAWINLIIALSIAVSPLLMKALDGYAARFLAGSVNAGPMDTEMDHNPVIIAGFGRYGQIVGRLMLASDVRVTVLDHNSEHIANMRQFGFKVYYGDAARLDLLEVAGARKARVLVVAVDDKDTITRIAALARKHFPHLQIVARAVDVPHAYELIREGAHVVQRELFESSLLAGRSVLEMLGCGAYEAREMTERFRHGNLEQLKATARISQTTERKEFISLLRRTREELEHQLQVQAQQPKVTHPWQQAPDREDA